MLEGGRCLTPSGTGFGRCLPVTPLNYFPAGAWVLPYFFDDFIGLSGCLAFVDSPAQDQGGFV